MYKNILVPLDGSELAEVALPYAEELSGKLGSNITLIHVREPIGHWTDRIHQAYMGQISQVTKQLVERYLDKSEERKVIKVESKILVGDPAEEIIKYAEKMNSDLIVMATHGQSGLKRWVIGSVADRVVRASKKPVWLIRAKSAHSNLREKDILDKALVTLDGSKESEAVIPYIEELASGLKAEVTLLQVLPLGYHGIHAEGEGYLYIYYNAEQMASDKKFVQGYLDKVVARLKQKGVAAKAEVRFGNAAEEIIALATDIRADVVAMSTHGRSGVGRWLLGSVTEKILHEGSNPLILVRSLGASMEGSSQHQEIKQKYLAASRS